ncbi:WXG100 family type VII secretion target [Mycolicibacterium litorale]|uniref:WXG100 family type VII secretion target n=1 Tax=Mycolicibacterium litorale TaxID=758802 RepID=UPI003CE6C4E0
MTVIGADPAQLRTTAGQFAQAADRLQGSLKGLNSVVLNTGIWRGPDSERFRSEWNGQSTHALNAAISALRAGAEVLRRNADEQDDASRADGGGSGGSTQYGKAASGLHDMWDEFRDVPHDSSGYRVQKVVGEDGVERYVVYIVGTDGSVTQTKWENVDAISGVTDDEQLDALVRLIPDGAEVMLVGYSQGGIDAQNIAASGRLNVSQIVTFGSPVRNDLDVSAVHLQDAFDPVPGSGIFNPQLYSGSAQNGNENVEVFSARSTTASPFGIDEHIGGYGELSEKWDEAAASGADSRAATSAGNFDRFQGSVVDQVDIDAKGNGSW